MDLNNHKDMKEFNKLEEERNLTYRVNEDIKVTPKEQDYSSESFVVLAKREVQRYQKANFDERNDHTYRQAMRFFHTARDEKGDSLAQQYTDTYFNNIEAIDKVCYKNCLTKCDYNRSCPIPEDKNINDIVNLGKTL